MGNMSPFNAPNFVYDLLIKKFEWFMILGFNMILLRH